MATQSDEKRWHLGFLQHLIPLDGKQTLVTVVRDWVCECDRMGALAEKSSGRWSYHVQGGSWWHELPAVILLCLTTARGDEKELIEVHAESSALLAKSNWDIKRLSKKKDMLSLHRRCQFQLMQDKKLQKRKKHIESKFVDLLMLRTTNSISVIIVIHR